MPDYFIGIDGGDRICLLGELSPHYPRWLFGANRARLVAARV